MTLIYISHALADIFHLCDDILVLRDGAVVAHGPKSEFDSEKLIALMVGRTLDQVFPTRHQSPQPEVVLQVSGLGREGVLDNISFELHAGEILGLAGLMGAGRSEVARALFGLDPHDAGAVRLRGSVIKHFSPRALMHRGIAFLTENRRTEGLCMEGQISENLLLAGLPELATGPARRLSRKRLQPSIARLRSLVHLDAKARDEQPVRTLSGGNQQKVVLGKWLLREPQILILDEPTRGIDVGAKSELYRLIHELADSGMAVLLISSEIEELIGLSDRILVMRRGRIIDELARAEFDRERILRSALGSVEKAA
jgi:ribose transport system ATP-binding protein